MNKRQNDDEEEIAHKASRIDQKLDVIDIQGLNMSTEDSPQKKRVARSVALPSKPRPQKSNTRTPAPFQQQMRAILTAREAAQVIGTHFECRGMIKGKKGVNIAAIRSESGARVIISDNQSVMDRIVTVTGVIDQVAKAFALIVAAAIPSTPNLPSHSTPDPSLSFSLGILIPSNHMGCVIGKSGTKIKFIQDQSSATIHASPHPLPGSNERVVTLTGVVDAIHIAVYHVGVALQSAVEDGRPQPIQSQSTPRQPQAHQYIPMYSEDTHQSSYPPPPPMNTTHQPYYAMGHNHPPYHAVMQGHDIKLQNYPHRLLDGLVTDTMQIPATMGKVLIGTKSVLTAYQKGKGGCTINNIRSTSGSQITVKEVDKTDPKTQNVVVVGSYGGNQVALQMINEIVFGR